MSNRTSAPSLLLASPPGRHPRASDPTCRPAPRSGAASIERLDGRPVAELHRGAGGSHTQPFGTSGVRRPTPAVQRACPSLAHSRTEPSRLRVRHLRRADCRPDALIGPTGRAVVDPLSIVERLAAGTLPDSIEEVRDALAVGDSPDGLRKETRDGDHLDLRRGHDRVGFNAIGHEQTLDWAVI